jgi:hypothetical protein
MSVIRCETNYPYPVFRTPGKLLSFTGKLRRGDFLAVRRHQVAPLIETAVRKIMEAIPYSFSIANVSMVGLGQILWQRIKDRQRDCELLVLDPYRVFVRYLAYKEKEIESYSALKEKQRETPHLHRERIPELLPGIDRIMTVSLMDGTANFINPELDAAIRGVLGSGSSFKRVSLHLEEDSDFDWGHLYTFRCRMDEHAAVQEFEIQESERGPIMESWR